MKPSEELKEGTLILYNKHPSVVRGIRPDPTKQAVYLLVEDMIDHGMYDANIVADVIIRLLSTVKNYLLKGGVLIVSGIIDTRADEVENACHEAGFVTEKRLEHGGWVAIKLRY